MKKGIKIFLIIIGILIGIILLDTVQALVFNNNPVLGIETKCMHKQGIIVDTYHCDDDVNVTVLKKTNVCHYDDVCHREVMTDYLVNPKDINDLIVEYLSKDNADLSNTSYNYVDEETNKVIVGLIDISEEKQNEFYNNVFLECCGKYYINYLKKYKLITFIESVATFEAKIIAVNNDSLTVRVLKDSKSFKYSSEVIIRLLNDDNNIYSINDKIKVTFNGLVLDSNPAQIGATKIEIIN